MKTQDLYEAPQCEILKVMLDGGLLGLSDWGEGGTPGSDPEEDDLIEF